MMSLNIKSHLCSALSILFLSLFLSTTIGCGNNKQSAPTKDEDAYFEDARFIHADSLGDGEMAVSLINPWDSTQLLAEYHLVNEAVTPTGAYSGNGLKLSVPLRRLVVYSAVHAALLCELGYADAIVGVADAQYIKTPEILDRLADGRISDVGSSTDPSLEKIVALKPDALLISPFQNAGHGVVDKSGIPVIECADYMETTPLGRAEWSKFYAMLVEGIAQQNAAIYNNVKSRYTALRDKWCNATDKPRVITELQQRGTWMVPGGRSFAAQMIKDAGGVYPFADNPSPGSLQYPYEKVYMAAENCDIWLLKSLSDITLEDVANNTKFNRKIWAFSHGGIYNANTSASPYYEETPFHPDLLLQDYVTIFHHTPDSLRYFAPVR